MRLSEWRRVANKIGKMDRRELTDRARQEFRKRWDTLCAHLGKDLATNTLANEPPAEGVFFFDHTRVGEILELLGQRTPHQVAHIVAKSERILAHRFDLLGFEDLDYGKRIDWHLDAVHTKRAPLKPFYAIKYLDFDEVGDSKVIWELNRHQHLVTLAKAYRLTNDRRFAVELFAQWQGWNSANPYPFGINWASSLEVGFRSLSWIWVYHLLAGTEALPAGFRREWLRAQSLNGRHLERYLSTYFSPNTHLLGEAVALFFLGVLCPELPRAPHWRALGWQIILREAHRQVLHDGMHFEHSTYYHVYAVDFLLHATILATLNSVDVPVELERTIEKMLNALFLLCQACPPPMFGDDDGGRVFDPARNKAEHLRDPLAAGAILFQRGDFKSLLRIPTEESIWLLGAAGLERCDALEPKLTPPSSSALPVAGIFSLRNQRGNLTVRSGPAAGHSRGHDHADGLSICLDSKGKPLLLDPGTYEYVGAGGERNVFRGTAMHNTLRVDGKDQCEPNGPFSWKQQFHASVEVWLQGENFDLFTGSHDGYQRLSPPVRHRRWVVGLKSGIFLVRDLVEGKGVHQLDVSWHLGPDLVVHGENVFRVKDTIQGLGLLPQDNHDWSFSVHRGPCSPVYGKQSSAIVLNYGKRASLPSEFVSVLIPFEDIATNPGRITRSEDNGDSGNVSAYQYESADLKHSLYFPSAIGAWKSGPISSDAEFVCVSARRDGTPIVVIFCYGKYVQIAGFREFRTTGKVERFEWTPSGVSCSDSREAELAAEQFIQPEPAEHPE